MDIMMFIVFIILSNKKTKGYQIGEAFALVWVFKTFFEISVSRKLKPFKIWNFFLHLKILIS